MQDDPISQGVVSSNGLASVNGLSSTNGLISTNGLASTNGLMTYTAGRATVDYLAKCALGSSGYIDKQDNVGTWRRYHGKMDIGTNWKNGACDADCQQKISASCLHT